MCMALRAADDLARSVFLGIACFPCEFHVATTGLKSFHVLISLYFHDFHVFLSGRASGTFPAHDFLSRGGPKIIKPL